MTHRNAVVAGVVSLAVVFSLAPRVAACWGMHLSEPHFDPRTPGPVVSVSHAPVPISGGTLLTLRDGYTLIVADPERDRISVVDPRLPPEEAVIAEIDDLERGAEPTRSVEDRAGHVHVVLRGVGSTLTFNPRDPRERRINSVCSMPRGIAYDPATDAIHVACRGGELVTYLATGSRLLRTLKLGVDLRDVLVDGDRLYVSRFRTAELLTIDAQGRVVDHARPLPFSNDTETFRDEVAWRIALLPDHRVAMVHQRATTGEVRVTSGGYGSSMVGCGGIVRSAVSIFGGSEPAVVGANLDDAVLPVDLAVRGQHVAVVSAGNQRGIDAVLVWSRDELTAACTGGDRLLGDTVLPNPTAVTFLDDGRIVVQQRDPARITIRDIAPRSAFEVPAEPVHIALGGEPTFDTGHAIFHVATGRQIACASCHPEGGDDGHTWRFEGVGERRTPALHAAAGTAPFHWSGELANTTALVEEVFVSRMGGAHFSTAHDEALERWLAHVPAPRASHDDADSNAVARGRALFEGNAGCATCHGGPRYGNGESADVGTGGAFQVPSLLGVGHRLPVMHDGCATTLRARFEPSCGGDHHGPALSRAEVDDLVAFLSSI